MDYQNLEQDLRKKIENELENSGIPLHTFNPGDVRLNRIGQEIRIIYKGIEVRVPAPSQEAIDSWWQENGKYFAGAIIALAAVIVGAMVVSRD